MSKKDTDQPLQDGKKHADDQRVSKTTIINDRKGN